jgi:hypothetical protein
MEGTMKMGVDMGAVEQKMVARWRALPPAATPSSKPKSKSKATRPQDRVVLAWTRHMWDDDASALELVEWMFIADGPHACLSFLDHLTCPGYDDYDDEAWGVGSDSSKMDRDKEALFYEAGPELVSFLLKQSRGGAVSRRVLALHDGPVRLRPPDWERQRRLWARLSRACRADNERVASVLIQYLGYVYGTHARARAQTRPTLNGGRTGLRPDWADHPVDMGLAEETLRQLRKHSNPSFIVCTRTCSCLLVFLTRRV